MTIATIKAALLMIAAFLVDLAPFVIAVALTHAASGFWFSDPVIAHLIGGLALWFAVKGVLGMTE